MATWVRAAKLPVAVLLFVVLGASLRFWPSAMWWSDVVWMGGLLITGAPVVWRTLRHAVAGHFATDLVATLAIVTAVMLQQPFAGLIVVLMQTGGEALERYAQGRASAALRALEEAAPRIAHRVHDDTIEDIAAGEISVGDIVLIRPGELIPCDAVVTGGRSQIDTTALTGEPMPIGAEEGVKLMSGCLNLEGSLTARATAISSESQYGRIVQLVRSAQASKAPLQRLADRYAIWFTPVTLAVCLVAYILTQDPIRVLAVLVVATPCPLILATPVAIIGGINRAARRQVIVRHGGAFEQLAGITVAVFDKTGTLTIGLPAVSRVVAAPGFTQREVMRLAASIEQGSSHLLARTLVEAAAKADVSLAAAYHVTESPGRGVAGRVDGREVVVGGRSFVLDRHPKAASAISGLDGKAGLRAFVAIDGNGAGMIEYADHIRPGLGRFFQDLRRLGISRIILLSGDRQAYTRAVADAVGIPEATGDLLPQDKAQVVRQLVAAGESVVMVGDGTNDAPALSSATVGIALAGHGGGITAEAADIVVLVDDLTRVVDAIRISRRTLRIAKQSIWAGLGLSATAMVFAALGMIPPTIGAFLQEGIDVTVILNALRTSRQTALK